MKNEETSLIGRYVKVLKSHPYGISSLIKGDYALIISEYSLDDLKGGRNSKDWTWCASNIGDCFELMPIGFKPYSHSDLLKEAIIKYPIGTKFKSATTGQIFTVKNHDFNKGGNICFETIEPNISGNHIGCVHSNGKWAEIVKETEFEENNWYECGDGFRGYLKLKEVGRDNYIYSERILSDGTYLKEEGSAKWRNISKANMSEVQKYLPNYHPDKIKKEVTPEYVKCIKGSSECKYDVLGKIYKVEDYDSNCGNLKILGTNISNIFFGEKSLIDVNRTDYKISTKEEFEKQNKPTIDLTNTKIWIGDNPELSKKVQEKAFELGYSWNNGQKDLQYLSAKSLFFYEDKIIAFSNGDKSYFISDKNKKEIFPSDLGIFTSVCETNLGKYIEFRPRNLEKDFKHAIGIGIDLYKENIKLGPPILPIDEPKHVKVIKRRETNF